MTKKLGKVLQKTGCSFCSRVLDAISYSKENFYHQTNPELDSDKVYMINVRNPWDFYVSLYTYTYNLKGNGPNLRSTTQVVGPEVKGNFKLFLKTVLEHKTYHQQDNIVWKSANVKLGLLSYRLMAFLAQKKACEVVVGSMEEIEHYFISLINSENIEFMRQEDLYRELYAAIEKNEALFEDNLKDDWKTIIKEFEIYSDFRNVINPDEFMKIRQEDQDYRSFYDEETIQLVAEKDALIIKYFNYKYN